MSNIEFDLIKLKQLGDIDVRSAIKHFNSYEEYFGELNKFIKESKYYLSAYTAEMVARDESERKDFRADIKKIKGDLVALGITYPIESLNEVDYESERGDIDALTDWINKFHTEIGKMTGCVTAALIVNEDATAKGPNPPIMEKPIILAADDKPELLTAVVNMLEERFKVMAVTSGKAALRLIEKHHPKLFLLDIEMPQMDGYELAEMIRKQKIFASTPIVFLTSKNTREDVMSAIKRGGNDYLVKPVNKDLLLNKVLQHLGMV